MTFLWCSENKVGVSNFEFTCKWTVRSIDVLKNSNFIVLIRAYGLEGKRSDFYGDKTIIGHYIFLRIYFLSGTAL